MDNERRPVGHLLLHGVIGGIIGGLIFAVFYIVLGTLTMGSFDVPFRIIASMPLGTETISPTYPLVTAVIAGTIIHMTLAAVYGAAFALLLSFARRICGPTGLVMLYGVIFGLALWVINYLIIAPSMWPQFTQVNQFWFGFVGNTFFYGTILGIYIGAIWPERVPAIIRDYAVC